MEKKLILRGLLAGAVGGTLAFVFARIFAQPLIQRAIDYEGGRAAAEAALLKFDLPAYEAEVVTRSVQENAGLGIGFVFFGIVLGGLFAVTYALCLGRTGCVRPRQLALLVGLAGFVVVAFVPFLKYPANPPAVGNDETVSQRTGLYLVMLLVSLLAAVIAVAVGQSLRTRVGTWNAALLAGAGFVVAVGIAMLVLPPLGHLDANVAAFGKHATETPLPLRDDAGNIVFPGFPADVLAEFRVYAIGAQALLWAAIAVVFAPLADRVLAPGPSESLARTRESAIVR